MCRGATPGRSIAPKPLRPDIYANALACQHRPPDNCFTFLDLAVQRGRFHIHRCVVRRKGAQKKGLQSPSGVAEYSIWLSCRFRRDDTERLTIQWRLSSFSGLKASCCQYSTETGRCENAARAPRLIAAGCPRLGLVAPIFMS